MHSRCCSSSTDRVKRASNDHASTAGGLLHQHLIISPRPRCVAQHVHPGNPRMPTDVLRPAVNETHSTRTPTASTETPAPAGTGAFCYGRDMAALPNIVPYRVVVIRQPAALACIITSPNKSSPRANCHHVRLKLNTDEHAMNGNRRSNMPGVNRRLAASPTWKSSSCSTRRALRACD